ncbi:MAG: type II secretion system F family protein [Pseudomonadota bacterium]
MPDFTYHAVDASGKATDGTMSADNERALENALREVGLWLVEAKEKTKKAQRKQRNQKVPRRELIDFFNGMSALMNAGIPVAEAFQGMAEETTHESLRLILEDVSVNVQSGQDVSSALASFPKVFSPQICQLISAGEYSGNLEATFEDLSGHLEWVDKIRADIKQASIYPAMIVVAVAGLIALMFIVVVPRFADIFTKLDIELPALTRGVIRLGELAQSGWWVALLTIVGTVVGVKVGRKKSEKFAIEFDRLKLRIPIFGNLIAMLVQSQFVHNLALMLRAGVPIIEALGQCEGLTQNRVMDKAIGEAQEEVQRGGKVSEALRNHDVVSSLTLRMIVVGEESGRLDGALEQVAKRFDTEIPRQIKRLFSLLEPTITLTLVVVVGLVAASIFMPMLSLATGIS